MSLIQPTTKEISDNIIAQLEATLNQTIPLFPKAFNRVLAKALGGLFVILFKYGGSIFLNIFVSTASTRETVINGRTLIPLVELGRLVGAGDPVAATPAQLLIDITVTNQVGQLDSGTQLVNSENGVTYITNGAVLLDAPVVQVTILAVSDQAGGDGSGVIGNLEPGAIVSFANPLANVVRDAIVDSQVVTGADGEDLDTVYRQRVLDRFQKRPQGGALADYEEWGEEVAGIINVFPYTSDCPGQVDVFAEATVESSGDPDGKPTAAQLQAVLDSIELDEAGLATRRPANALVNAFAIARTAFVVEIVGLDVTDPASVQVSITTAITDFFLRRSPFIEGLTVPPRADRISRSEVESIAGQVVANAGGVFSGAILKLDGDPIELFTLGQGEKAKATVVFI